AESKQARDIVVLDVRDVTSFADEFLICTGGNTRPIQAITHEIEQQGKKKSEYPKKIEGYSKTPRGLVDYGDFVVYIFSQKARVYYDLERLWRDAKPLKW